MNDIHTIYFEKENYIVNRKKQWIAWLLCLTIVLGIPFASNQHITAHAETIGEIGTELINPQYAQYCTACGYKGLT